LLALLWLGGSVGAGAGRAAVVQRERGQAMAAGRAPEQPMVAPRERPSALVSRLLDIVVNANMMA